MTGHRDDMTATDGNSDGLAQLEPMTAEMYENTHKLS